MDKTTIIEPAFYDETRFRTPLAAERDIGLWVDRLGEGRSAASVSTLRRLGQFALVKIVKGTGFLTTLRWPTMKLTPGDVFVVFPEEPTFYSPDTHWQHHYVVFNGPDAHKLREIGYLSPQQMIINNGGTLFTDSYERLAALMPDESLAAVLARKTLVLELILQLYQAHPSAQTRRGDQVIESVIHYMEIHYHQSLTAEQLSRRSCLSPSHFRRRFKDYTGRTPMAFLVSLRISRAKSLLARGLPIKQVAREVGYDDVFYFMRLFKKTTGVTCKRFC